MLVVGGIAPGTCTGWTIAGIGAYGTDAVACKGGPLYAEVGPCDADDGFIIGIAPYDALPADAGGYAVTFGAKLTCEVRGWARLTGCC